MVDAGIILDGSSGIPLIALAIFVATRRSAQTTNLYLAGFSGLWGLSKIASNWLRVLGWDPPAMYIVSNVAFLVTALLLLGLISRTPAPRQHFVWLAAGAVALHLVEAMVSPTTSPTTGFFHGNLGIMAASIVCIAVLSMRYGRTGSDQTSIGLMTAALSLDAGLRAGIHVVTFTPGGIPSVALLAFASAVWLWNCSTAISARESRTCRDLALLLLSLPLVGMVMQLATRTNVGDSGIFGVARILVVAILAYAILRHQLLGMDVKIRWTISKTVLAGIFVAVFFVVSEGAQEFFGATLGSQYIGILAAGLLVFAIAPLSRLTERVAERAVPGPQLINERQKNQRVALYFEMAKAAWGDGNLTTKEREVLDVAREGLDITADDAVQIEREARKSGDAT